jgi:hypothetical protein
MSSAVFAVRAFLANLLLLPLTPLYQFYFGRDTHRNYEMRVGNCRFWGSESFTSTCRSAMEELRSADEDLFAALTSSGPITFWLKSAGIRRRIYNKISRFYAVDPAYFAWGPRGIVTFVIAIHFDERYTRRLF